VVSIYIPLLSNKSTACALVYGITEYNQPNMKYPDKIPETLQNKQFPIGDVTETRTLDKAQTWIDDIITNYNNDRFINMIKSLYRNDPMENNAVRNNRAEAEKLCRAWNDRQGGNRHFAIKGFIIAQLFIRQTRILPAYDRDLTQDLQYMQTEHTNDAVVFGKDAYAGMQACHPNVYEKFKQVLNYCGDIYDFEPEENRQHFVAGMMLPYMLASTTRLMGYTQINGFTSMAEVSEKTDLQKTDFSKLFSKTVTLVSEDPAKRLPNQ
jgi:hypothetical protein